MTLICLFDKVIQKYRNKVYETECNHMGTYISIDLILSYINGERDSKGTQTFSYVSRLFNVLQVLSAPWKFKP